MESAQTIAIYLGIDGEKELKALSSQFFHLIVASPSPLLANASIPKNVTLCPFAVFSRKTSLFWNSGALKEKRDHPDDVAICSLTLKQIIHDFVYRNEELSQREISQIICDLKGFEEHILEDLLYFAHFNRVSVSISLHPEIWLSHSKPLSFFTAEKTDLNTFLLTPKKTEKFFLKKNIPVLILCYNQLTFLKNMVAQVEKYTKDIIVIDNCSTYKPLLDYYAEEFSYTLLAQKENFGHLIYRSPLIKKLTGEVYLLTDPDLQLHPHLPDNFIEKLFAISLHFQAIRVGFALKIDSENLREGKFFYGHSIHEWEQRFWQYKIPYPEDPDMELYEGLIDTTFCLVNRRFSNRHIRVAKDYTCVHIPWHKHFEKLLLPGEYEAYLVNNKSTTYWK